MIALHFHNLFSIYCYGYSFELLFKTCYKKETWNEYHDYKDLYYGYNKGTILTISFILMLMPMIVKYDYGGDKFYLFLLIFFYSQLCTFVANS